MKFIYIKNIYFVGYVAFKCKITADYN